MPGWVDASQTTIASRGSPSGARVEAVRAHLLERAGLRAEARAAFLAAARLTASVPERRYLEAKALTLPEH